MTPPFGVVDGAGEPDSYTVVVQGVVVAASRPKMTWGFEVPVVLRSGMSDERRTIVQCGFCFPRVGKMKARRMDERGIVASRVCVERLVNLIEDL